MKCLGITGKLENFNRCKNDAKQWFLFCHLHKRQIYYWLFFAIIPLGFGIYSTIPSSSSDDTSTGTKTPNQYLDSGIITILLFDYVTKLPIDDSASLEVNDFSIGTVIHGKSKLPRSLFDSSFYFKILSHKYSVFDTTISKYTPDDTLRFLLKPILN